MKHDNQENVRDKNCDCRTINRMQIKASGNIKEIKKQNNFSTITMEEGEVLMVILIDTEAVVALSSFQRTRYRLGTYQIRETKS